MVKCLQQYQRCIDNDIDGTGGSGVIPLGGYKLRFYLRLTMPDEISIPGLLKRLLWIENRRCNRILVPYQWVCGSLGRVGGTGGGHRGHVLLS